jgi:hypothetical protein
MCSENKKPGIPMLQNSEISCATSPNIKSTKFCCFFSRTDDLLKCKKSRRHKNYEHKMYSEIPLRLFKLESSWNSRHTRPFVLINFQQAVDICAWL